MRKELNPKDVIRSYLLDKIKETSKKLDDEVKKYDLTDVRLRSDYGRAWMNVQDVLIRSLPSADTKHLEVIVERLRKSITEIPLIVKAEKKFWDAKSTRK